MLTSATFKAFLLLDWASLLDPNVRDLNLGFAQELSKVTFWIPVMKF